MAQRGRLKRLPRGGTKCLGARRLADEAAAAGLSGQMADVGFQR